MTAVIGGTSAIISIDVLAPIVANALNRKRSPNTNPIIPDKLSHSHANPEASVGKGLPRNIHANTVKRAKAKYIFMTLSDSEPIFLDEYSKHRATNVQHTAVASAASWPGLI